MAVPADRAAADVSSETARHAGHADILREQLDGTTGRRPTSEAPGSCGQPAGTMCRIAGMMGPR